MFRFTFTVYMLLLTLIGPSLCCCTLARVIAKVRGMAGISKDHLAPPLGCCQSQPENDLQDTQDDSELQVGVSRQQSPTGHCKCQKNVRAAVPSTGFDFAIGLNGLWSDGLTLTLAAPGLLEAAVICPVVIRVAETPPVFRSGREIHIDIHSWRC